MRYANQQLVQTYTEYWDIKTALQKSSVYLYSIFIF